MLLIISVNVLRIFFSSTKEHALDSNDLSPAAVKTKFIIKLLKKFLEALDHDRFSKTIGVTEVVLRDAHQSLLATRFRYHDMEAALKDLDSVGLVS